MDADTCTLCTMIRNRSRENGRAMQCLADNLQDTMSPAFSILRQELDSMIRVIYLLNVKDPAERRELIHATLGGRKMESQNSQR